MSSQRGSTKKPMDDEAFYDWVIEALTKGGAMAEGIKPLRNTHYDNIIAHIQGLNKDKEKILVPLLKDIRKCGEEATDDFEDFVELGTETNWHNFMHCMLDEMEKVGVEPRDLDDVKQLAVGMRVSDKEVEKILGPYTPEFLGGDPEKRRLREGEREEGAE